MERDTTTIILESNNLNLSTFILSAENQTYRNQSEHSEDASITEFVFEGILSSVISVFGFLGNIGAIVLFTKMKRQLKFHRLMMMLSAFDLIYVTLSFMLFALPIVSITITSNLSWILLVNGFTYSILCISSLL